METSYFFLSLSISRYPDLQRAEREFSRMSDVETVTIGGHEGFGRHLLSNLLSWGRDERNEGKDVDEEKGRRRGMERWRTGTPNGKSLKMRSHLLHIYIYFYYIYIHTRYMDTLYRGRCVHFFCIFLGQHFHSIGFTRFFPRFPAIRDSSRCLASSASAFSAVHINFWCAVHESVRKYLPPT